MKSIKFLLALSALALLLSCDSIFNRVQEKVEQKVQEKIDKTIDDVVNKMDSTVSKMSLDSLKVIKKSLDSVYDKSAKKLKEKTGNK